MRKIEKLGIKGRNQAGAFEILRPSASVSFRGSPWTSAECVDDRRGMRDGKYDEKKESEIGHRRQNQGRGWRNIDSVSLRQPPRTSVDARDMCGQETEDGQCEIMRGRRKSEYMAEARARLAKYCFCQPPSASAEVH